MALAPQIVLLPFQFRGRRFSVSIDGENGAIWFPNHLTFHLQEQDHIKDERCVKLLWIKLLMVRPDSCCRTIPISNGRGKALKPLLRRVASTLPIIPAEKVCELDNIIFAC
jgi:hypothetical protein